MKWKILFLVGIFSLGVWTAYVLQPGRSPERPPVAGFGPGSLLLWGLVVIVLLAAAGGTAAFIYWAFLRARTGGTTIHARQGLFPLIAGVLAEGERYIFDPNRTASPATLFNQSRGQIYFVDGGPEAVRIVSQAQFTQALVASGGSVPPQQIVQALSPVDRMNKDTYPPLPPILPLPETISLSHLDSLVEKLDDSTF